MVLDPKNDNLSDEAELLIYEAARAQIVAEVIRPALERGAVVLCDRFADSTIAYQVHGRGLDAAFVEQANAFACQGSSPDRTILLTTGGSARTGLSRATHRGADRLERAGEELPHARERGASWTSRGPTPTACAWCSRPRGSRGRRRLVFRELADLFPWMADVVDDPPYFAPLDVRRPRPQGARGGSGHRGGSNGNNRGSGGTRNGAEGGAKGKGGNRGNPGSESRPQRRRPGQAGEALAGLGRRRPARQGPGEVGRGRRLREHTRAAAGARVPSRERGERARDACVPVHGPGRLEQDDGRLCAGPGAAVPEGPPRPTGRRVRRLRHLPARQAQEAPRRALLRARGRRRLPGGPNPRHRGRHGARAHPGRPQDIHPRPRGPAGRPGGQRLPEDAGGAPVRRGADPPGPHARERSAHHLVALPGGAVPPHPGQRGRRHPGAEHGRVAARRPASPSRRATAPSRAASSS